VPSPRPPPQLPAALRLVLGRCALVLRPCAQRSTARRAGVRNLPRTNRDRGSSGGWLGATRNDKPDATLPRAGRERTRSLGQSPLGTGNSRQADGGTRTPDPIITSQPIAPHARLRVRTPAHESPAPGQKPIGRIQARVRPGCRPKDPGRTRPAGHDTRRAADVELTVPSDVRFGVPLPCPRCGRWRAPCAPHQSARREHSLAGL
jgi:hypothetical protein